MPLNIKQKIHEQEPRMQEMLCCFIYQGLSEIPWEITLGEYLWLEDIIDKE